MSQTGHISLGQQGEEVACYFLQKRGYRILERNYTNPTGVRQGEVDIIAEYKGRIVFVEVKTRKQKKGEVVTPEMNINRAKLHKLAKIATFYLRQTRQGERAYGFDAVTVCIDEGTGKASVRHIPDIFI